MGQKIANAAHSASGTIRVADRVMGSNDPA
jgi:hypothetical protein